MNVKKILLRMGMLFAVFLFVIAAVFFLQEGETDVNITLMKDATLPVIYMSYGEEQFNCLYGYVGEMDSSSIRDTLTPLEPSRNLKIYIQNHGQKITGITYEVRSLDQERLIEKTTVTDFKTVSNREGSITEAVFPIENLIEEDSEYQLTINLATETEPSIRYYTRIYHGMDQVLEKISFVTEFSEKTFDKTEAESLIPYLESGSQGDNTNFAKVNIYSSFNQIAWGNLNPERVSDSQISVKEVNGDITSMQLDYRVKFQNMYGTEECYNVTEFFRTRYTETRTYLLSYERTMEQIFQPVSENISGSRINLGISSDMDVDMKTDSEGKIVCFVKERELWAYDYSSNEMKSIFSFSDKNTDDGRLLLDQHQIKIIEVDKDGNMFFVVYGYMNRGANEGNVGIALYKYTKDINIAEELLFIPYGKSYQYLEQSLGSLFYISEGTSFYFLLEGSLYSVDLKSLEYVEIVSGLKEDCYVTNEKGNILAWQVENELYDSMQIKEIQLDTNREFVISAGTGERIRVIGFIEDDLVYGTAKPEDIYTTVNGRTEFYMSSLYIVDSNNQKAGTYQKENYYFTEAVIDENMITLERYTKNAERSFAPAQEDYITNNTASVGNKLTLSMIATDLKKKELGINLATSVSGSGLKNDVTKEVVTVEGRNLLLEDLSRVPFSYYVYGRGRLLEAENDITGAIALADEEAGVVVDSKGNYIWKRGNQNSTKTLNTVSVVPAEENTIAAALNGMLKYAGAAVDSEELLAEGMSIMEIVDTALVGRGLNLTGCSLRQVLYFVNAGNPVMAKTEAGHYVLVVGYDMYNAVLLDCRTNSTYKIGLEDGTEMFQRAGNEFLSYFS